MIGIKENHYILLLSETIKYMCLYNICIVDIKKKIISDRYIIMLFFIGLTEAVLKLEIQKYYIGMSVFCMPLLFLYVIEDYFDREFIGFGDVKLMMVLGGELHMRISGTVEGSSIKQVWDFYMYLYTISGIFSFVLLILLKIYNKIRKESRKIMYIPFAPFIIISCIIMQFKTR